VVGDLTVGHGARRKLAVPDVLQGEAPGASPCSTAFIAARPMSSPTAGVLKKAGPFILGTLNRTSLSLWSAIYVSPLSRM
jgi:hypothetical protein